MKPTLIDPVKNVYYEIVPKIEKGKFTLKELQDYVGGYIEIVRSDELPGMIIVVDEEGLIKEKPFNLLISFMTSLKLVGVALVIPEEMVD